MTYDHLIAEIVEQVLKKLQQLPRENTLSLPHTPLPQMVIIGNFDTRQLECLNEAYKVVAFPLATKNFDALCITSLSLQLLTQLALGNNHSRESNMILQGLMEGKKVYVLESGIAYHQFKQSAPKTLYNLYMSYEERIQQYGIVFIKQITDLLTPTKPLSITSTKYTGKDTLQKSTISSKPFPLQKKNYCTKQI